MGGCVNGKCQMPLGVTNVGYHFYTDLDMSICYNCIDSEHCCLDQLDRKKYSKLKSPIGHSVRNSQSYLPLCSIVL